MGMLLRKTDSENPSKQDDTGTSPSNNLVITLTGIGLRNSDKENPS